MDNLTMADDGLHALKFDHISSQLWAFFLPVGIFLQITYLIRHSDVFPLYKIYTIMALFIGLIILIFLLFIIWQEKFDSEVIIRFQSHHFLVIFVSGIVISFYYLFNVINIFTVEYITLIKDRSCSEEYTCKMFHLLTFFLIILQIIFFSIISGKKLPNNIKYKANFITLMVVNLLCYTTMLTNEITSRQTVANMTMLTNKTSTVPTINSFLISQDSPRNEEMMNFTVLHIENQLIAEQTFATFALQYFFMAAYLMFNLGSEINQPSQAENDTKQTFTFQLLYHSVRRWLCHRNEEELLPKPKFSKLIPFIKIFQTKSGILIGSILSIVFLSSNIFFNYNILNNRYKNDDSTNYYKYSLATNIINQLMIIISICFAYNDICSISRFSGIQRRNHKEIKGDKLFLIFAYCGSIIKNLIGFYAVFFNQTTDTNLLIAFGIEHVIGFINSILQTHFILCGLDLQVKITNENSCHDEERKRQIAQTLRAASIVCGMLNLTTSFAYVYELHLTYFNTIIDKAFGNGATWKSIQLHTMPLLIFYRLYSSLCIFKIVVEFSNIKQKSTSNVILNANVIQNEHISIPDYIYNRYNI